MRRDERTIRFGAASGANLQVKMLAEYIQDIHDSEPMAAESGVEHITLSLHGSCHDKI
jgi:hypothetical protein